MSDPKRTEGLLTGFLHPSQTEPNTVQIAIHALWKDVRSSTFDVDTSNPIVAISIIMEESRIFCEEHKISKISVSKRTKTLLSPFIPIPDVINFPTKDRPNA